MNRGAPLFKKLPGAFQGARHKGLLSLVENVDHCVVLLVFKNDCSVRSLRDARLGGGSPLGKVRNRQFETG